MRVQQRYVQGSYRELARMLLGEQLQRGAQSQRALRIGSAFCQRRAKKFSQNCVNGAFAVWRTHSVRRTTCAWCVGPDSRSLIGRAAAQAALRYAHVDQSQRPRPMATRKQQRGNVSPPTLFFFIRRFSYLHPFLRLQHSEDRNPPNRFIFAALQRPRPSSRPDPPSSSHNQPPPTPFCHFRTR